MQGGWFNHERILNRDDVEIYSIPSWKYHVYYSVIIYKCIFSVFFAPKKSNNSFKNTCFFFVGFNNIVVFVIDFYRMRYLDFPQLNLAD